MLVARPAAVIFDMDGLLLDTERLVRDSMMAAMADMGLTMTEADFARLIGVPEDGNRVQLAQMYGAGFDYDEMRERQRAIVVARWGTHRPVKPHARETVALARDLGLPVAVATSTARRFAEPNLAQANILPLLDALLTRDDVMRGKPHPDLYLAAAAQLDVAPGDALALEDSHNGVRAAHAAGVPVIMVPDLLPVTDEMRALVLAVAPDLAAVADALTRMGG